MHFPVVREQEPQSMEELFPEKRLPTDINVVISARFMSPELKEAFPTISELHHFLGNCLGDQNRVTISHEEIVLIKDDRKVVLSIGELLHLQAERNRVVIDLDNIQDKLLLFSQKQWEILDSLDLNKSERDKEEKGKEDDN